VCVATDAKEDAVKKEIEGTWKVLKSIKAGDTTSDEELKNLPGISDRVTSYRG
jgi:hypothetical protein